MLQEIKIFSELLSHIQGGVVNDVGLKQIKAYVIILVILYLYMEIIRHIEDYENIQERKSYCDTSKTNEHSQCRWYFSATCFAVMFC